MTQHHDVDRTTQAHTEASGEMGRGSIDHPVTVLIVGAGPGGICTAILLQERGIDDVVLLEKSSGIGGTWHNNRYPGLACDVVSDHYSYSFRQDHAWTRNFSRPAQIVEYLCATVQQFNLWPKIVTDTSVVSATWLDGLQLWHVVDSHGAEHHARFLVGAVGMFNEVVRPDIPGLDTFAGPVVHTAEWPEDDRGLIVGKSVAVIGSAASAVQVVPSIAPVVAHLDQYQRTANWVFPKDDAVFTPEQVAARLLDREGRAEARRKSFQLLVDFNDFNNVPLMEELGRLALDNLRNVRDPATREQLVPRLPLGSQRPLQSSDYYDCFNGGNVALVTSPIEAITADAIVTADGQRRPADTIVLATGYAAHKFFSIVDVVGTGGTSLRELWSDGAYAYKGMAVEQFPNMFMLYGPNTNGGSIIDKLEIQARYIVAKIGFALQHGIAALEVRAEAVRAYDDRLQHEISNVNAWQTDGSRYYRAPTGRVVTQCPYTVDQYEELTLEDDLDDYVVTVDSTSNAAALP